ncbi:hypothetical protein [Leptospira stimsonii]|uniref:YCII-related domain-containing protein n=1 Tax=Leptospira stimsonii TaxID=2202203 RepID=A0ABY2MXE3_9LEPT|nr:hypothetical protein [Leptospira stimsonii]TGK19832.1 hypothetical protein EHO98_11175 [Leptospira stimsonii]TGM10966.1 hypothetical protein EHQ90_17390 [Leptospira stimsonii]
MKKSLLLSIGFEQPTQEIMKAWETWFALIKDRIADASGHFSKGREITRGGTIQLPLDLNAIAGYLIVHAESMDEAEEIALKCLIITSIKVLRLAHPEVNRDRPSQKMIIQGSYVRKSEQRIRIL